MRGRVLSRARFVDDLAPTCTHVRIRTRGLSNQLSMQLSMRPKASRSRHTRDALSSVLAPRARAGWARASDARAARREPTRAANPRAVRGSRGAAGFHPRSFARALLACWRGHETIQNKGTFETDHWNFRILREQ